MGWATLKADLPTSLGTYVKGTQVQFWWVQGKTATICLDPPQLPHPAKCHTYRIPIKDLEIQSP